MSFPRSCCGLCTRRMPSPKVSLSSAAVPSEPGEMARLAARLGPTSSSELGDLPNRVKIPPPF